MTKNILKTSLILLLLGHFVLMQNSSFAQKSRTKTSKTIVSPSEKSVEDYQFINIIKNTDFSRYTTNNYVVIFDSTIVDVLDNGLSYYSNHQLTKILSTEGAQQFKNVKIDYDAQSAFVEIKKVVIYRKDGTVENVNIANVKDYVAPARAIYWGASEKMLEIGRLEIGDVVEVVTFRKGFTYALLQTNDDEQYIPPMKGHFYDIIPFYSNQPIVSKTYQILLPKDKPLQFEFYNGECAPKVEFLANKNRYTFSVKNIMPLKAESNMVAWDDVAPKLLVSTSPNWEAKSIWFYNVNEDYKSFDPTPEVKEKVKSLLKGAKSELDSISVLTHWVADNIRYAGITMGKGEGFTLHNCEMNFTDRCGVCKDKASLLISFLRAAGFDSYPAMTMAGSRIDRIPADQFNHSVTIVKRRNGNLELLDPTWVPFVRELWSSAEQQQNYLIGLPQGADLMITPVSAPENHYFKMNSQSTLEKNGTLNGVFTLTAEGQMDASIRGLFTRSLISDWETIIEKEFVKAFPEAIISNVEMENPYNYMKGPINIKVKFSIPNFAVVGSNLLIFKPLSVSRLFNLSLSYLYWNTSIENRKYGFRDRTSRLVEISESISLPNNSTTSNSFTSYQLNGISNSCNYNWIQKGGKLLINSKTVFQKRIYEPSDWPNFKKCIEMQKQFGESNFIVNY